MKIVSALGLWWNPLHIDEAYVFIYSVLGIETHRQVNGNGSSSSYFNPNWTEL